GFRSLMINSNGLGGFHVYALFGVEISSDRVFMFCRHLTNDWSQFGFPSPPETFPRQAGVSGRTPYGNWLRLPGRHHTFEYWSHVWNGIEFVFGDLAIDEVLRSTPTGRATIPAELLITGRPTRGRQNFVTQRPVNRILELLVGVLPSSDPNSWRA